MSDWRYENHAMIAKGAPWTQADLAPLESGTIWRNKGYPLFARWVSDYDCGYPTEWWYCLKDNEYRIDTLSAKRRYCITRGRRFFSINAIDEREYVDELISVMRAAYVQYPRSYRPNITTEVMKKQIFSWERQRHICFGAFSRDDGRLCGFSLINEYETYGYYVTQKVLPDFENKEVNAALVDGILLYYNERIQKGYPLVDGQRNIYHETAFQAYLCKYFGFRRVYCRLNIRYRPWVKWIVDAIYPVRAFLRKGDGKLLHKINSLLLMEEISRSFQYNGDTNDR